MKEEASQVRRLRKHPIHRCAVPLSQWGRQRGGGFAAEKGSQPPALLCSVAPSKGRGSRGHSLLPMEGGAPKGRRLDGDSGMKESEEMHLKQAINESNLSTADAVPLPQWGRQRGGGFAAEKGSQPRLAALGSPFQGKGLAWTLPPSYGRRCPKGAEVGWREAV